MFSFPIQPARFYRINRSIDYGGGALWDIGPYAIHTLRQCFKENPIRVKAIAKMNEHKDQYPKALHLHFPLND